MILERIHGSRFSRVRRLWEGQTVVLIGGGTSLTIEQVELVRTTNVRCIAVNDAYLLAPWAEVSYAADSKFHRWHSKGVDEKGNPIELERAGLTKEEVIERWKSFAGQKCSIQGAGNNIEDDRVHILKNKTYPIHANGLSSEPEYLFTGRNSGYQALNLAVLSGARRVSLIGYDGKPGEKRTHWFGEHPTATPPDVFGAHRQAMKEAVPLLKKLGVEVINCSPGSAIECFPKMRLEDALCG